MPRVQTETYLKHEPIECLLNPPSEETKAVEKLYQAIVTSAAKALKAHTCSVFLVDAKSKEINQVAGTGRQKKFRGPTGRRVVPTAKVRQKPRNISEKLGMTAWIASTGRPFLVRTERELYGHPHHRGDYDHAMGLDGDKRIRTFLGVPIRGSQQDVVGLIKAERYTGKDVLAFSDKDEVCLSSIAVAAGRCLDYLRLSMSAGRGPRDAVTAWTSDVISMAASAEPDLSSFADVVAEMMTAVASADSSSIFLLDEPTGEPTGSYLMQVGGCGYQRKGNLIRSYRMPDPKDEGLHQGLTTYIAVTGEEVYLKSNEELEKHKAWRGQYDIENFKGKKEDCCVAFFGIPLQVGGTTLGVLKLENNKRGKRPDDKDPFPDDVRRQVGILSQAIALCIFRLRTQVSERYAEIGRATQAINAIMYTGGKLEDIAQRAINEISQLLNAEACALFILEEAEQKLVQYPWGAYGYANIIPEGEQREYTLKDRSQIKESPKGRSEKVGLTVWIAAMGRKCIAKSNEELKNHPHHLGTYDKDNFDLDKGQRCDSFMGVPLRVHQTIVGVLKIENKKKDEEGRHVQFTRADEFVFDMLASSLANAVYWMSERGKRKRGADNRTEFLEDVKTKEGTDTNKMWALGLVAEKSGLRGFEIDVPELPDDSVVVRTRSLGVCGTDIHAFGGKKTSRYDLVEFHEALGEVVWLGKAVKNNHYIQKGDIVVPVVRRCQTWDEPNSGSPVSFGFKQCIEASKCPAYRHPDACPQGEYPYKLDCDDVGYRSRGTGKCHGFGSQYWVDTPEWLVRVCSAKEADVKGTTAEGTMSIEDLINRLILVEPLAVVWKMKREIENVRAVRPFQDRMLTLGVGPIGWLATAVMKDMYPGLHMTAVDRVPSDRPWIKPLRGEYRTVYKKLKIKKDWHSDLTPQNGRFDIVVEATGCPQDVIDNAIDILAPNGILVILSVVGDGGKSYVGLRREALDKIVKKNAKIIGSVNESREDFENAISYLRNFHSAVQSNLDPLITRIKFDPPAWKALEKVTKLKDTEPEARESGPKIVLQA